MTENKEEKGFMEGVEITLKEVELKVSRNNDEQIEKITFRTTGRNITWKPKHIKETFEGGFKVIKTVPTERDMLPKKLVEMAALVSDKGQINLKVCYSYWKTEADGNPVTYRFINSEKMFDKWVILSDEVKQENVLP